MSFANDESSEARSDGQRPNSEMPTDRAVDEIRSLQRCINDLISVLALPAIWSGAEPSRVVNTLLDALVGMLQLDFAYARSNGRAGTFVDMLRLAPARALSDRSQRIGDAIDEWLGDGSQSLPPVTRMTLGGRDTSVVPLRLGVNGDEGLIIAASQRADFPRQTERLLMSVAVNQAVIGLQEARLRGEQKRVADELDRRVAQRTADLASANEELKREVSERRRAEEDRKRAEDAIRASERDLNQIINAIPALAWSALPEGSAEFFNQHYLDFVGLPAEEMQGSGWTAVVHPQDLAGVVASWEAMAASARPSETEGRLRRADGEYRWFLFRTNPLCDENGNIVKWYGINTDIEDRKQAEEKLRRSEAFLVEGQRLSMTGSFSWRIDTDEVSFSAELYRMFEFEFERETVVTLESIGSRIHPDDVPLLTEKQAEARRGGGDLEYEIRLRMPSGAVKRVHTIARKSRHRDGYPEYLGAIQEVTQRRHSEEALDKARSELAHVTRVMSLGTMTASIAHEVNQPLAGIITNASTCLRMLAAEPPNVDGARETARRTIRDGNRASDVITRLRALFSKKQATVELMDLNEATREVIALSLSELQRKKVVLRQDLADDLPSVSGDRVQLQQVILNLLLNAADAMSGVGDRPRELLIRTGSNEDDQVCVTVRDTGVGYCRGLRALARELTSVSVPASTCFFVAVLP